MTRAFRRVVSALSALVATTIAVENRYTRGPDTASHAATAEHEPAIGHERMRRARVPFEETHYVLELVQTVLRETRLSSGESCRRHLVGKKTSPRVMTAIDSWNARTQVGAVARTRERCRTHSVIAATSWHFIIALALSHNRRYATAERESSRVHAVADGGSPV